MDIKQYSADDVHIYCSYSNNITLLKQILKCSKKQCSNALGLQSVLSAWNALESEIHNARTRVFKQAIQCNN